MRLIKIIKKYFHNKDFCYPSDFFYLNEDIVKVKMKDQMFVTTIALILWFILSLVALVGYYLLLPFRLLHEWCEDWCYN